MAAMRNSTHDGATGSAVVPPREIFGWWFRGQRLIVVVLFFLVALDVLFMGLHVFAHFRAATNMLLYMDFDRGYAEFFQYLKFVGIGLLVVVWAIENRSWQLALWLIPFGYLLLDDAMRLHERGGDWLAHRKEVPAEWAVRIEDVGELLVTGAVALVCLVILLLAYFTADRVTRWVFRGFALLVVVLGLFGVLADVIHIAVGDWLPKFDWVVVFEDGGEMVAVSLLLAFALRINFADAERGVVRPGTEAVPGIAGTRIDESRAPAPTEPAAAAAD